MSTADPGPHGRGRVVSGRRRGSGRPPHRHRSCKPREGEQAAGQPMAQAGPDQRTARGWTLDVSGRRRTHRRAGHAPLPPLHPGSVMPRALRVCSQPGCPALTDSGRCEDHRRAAEQVRGSARDRGYGRAHRQRFRRGVLRRDPLCGCTDEDHSHGPRCLAPSTVADHWPRDRRELARLGLDANDPQYGRGLCKACHDRHTAWAQPGGWHAR
jgi:5-methylcytosine-specific restriction protein A